MTNGKVSEVKASGPFLMEKCRCGKVLFPRRPRIPDGDVGDTEDCDEDAWVHADSTRRSGQYQIRPDPVTSYCHRSSDLPCTSRMARLPRSRC
jgi:hypothetical protein